MELHLYSIAQLDAAAVDGFVQPGVAINCRTSSPQLLDVKRLNRGLHQLQQTLDPHCESTSRVSEQVKNRQWELRDLEPRTTHE
jgi:hypothetical protein